MHVCVQAYVRECVRIYIRNQAEDSIISEQFSFSSLSYLFSILGGTLAAAETEEKNSFLVKLADQMGPGGAQVGPWIGGQRIGGSWVWSKTGESLVYEDWLPGEPNHAHEDCIHYMSYDRMKWNNERCSSTLQFICEKPTPS